MACVFCEGAFKLPSFVLPRQDVTESQLLRKFPGILGEEDVLPHDVNRQVVGSSWMRLGWVELRKRTG